MQPVGWSLKYPINTTEQNLSSVVIHTDNIHNKSQYHGEEYFQVG